MRPRRIVRHWTPIEVFIVEQYALDHQDQLKQNLYRNIFAGTMLYRKKKGFFKQMSKLVDRPSKNCKSKFQKIERKIYVYLIGVPKDHYELFLLIRSGHRLGWNLGISEIGNLRFFNLFDGRGKELSISNLKKKVFEEECSPHNDAWGFGLKFEWLRYDLFQSFKRKCIESQISGRKAFICSRFLIG